MEKVRGSGFERGDGGDGTGDGGGGDDDGIMGGGVRQVRDAVKRELRGDGDASGTILEKRERNVLDFVNLDDEELTARICLRISERSVVTNEAIDKLFLKRLVTGEDDRGEDDDFGEDGKMGRLKTTRQERQMNRAHQLAVVLVYPSCHPTRARNGLETNYYVRHSSVIKYQIVSRMIMYQRSINTISIGS